ncbi:MAG: GAF domain-containing SpoIIE family protein phosphatase [Planctomycetota bacterium]
MPDQDDALRDLQTVLSVSRALGAERDLGRLLELIVRSASDLVNAERTSLFVLDRERNELWTRVAEGSAEIRLPVGRGIAGTVAASKSAINIPSAYDDLRFDPANDRRTGFRTRSILCMPMVNHEGAVVGVIQALNKRDMPAFGQRDEQVLDALAAQAGIALENAQLLQRDHERQRMLADLELARTIQLGLLPSSVPTVPGWRFAAWQRSCDQTGGDYHDFMTTPAGEIDAVVGDVSGHGIAAALLMGTARAFLRALHQQGLAIGPLVGKVNKLLEEDMADDAFMTMAICRFKPDGVVSYVSAGHDPPLVLRRMSGQFDVLESTGIALGMIDAFDYDPIQLAPLLRGDIVVLLTDGISEAHAPPSQELFTTERLRAVIAAASTGGAQSVRDAVVAAVDGWLHGHPQHDDMTFVVAERL